MRRNLLWLAFILIYHFLFWQESPGLNLVVFTLLGLSYQKIQSGQKRVSYRELIYALPLAFSAVAVLWINTHWSIFVLMLSFVVYSGYLSNRQSSALENFFSGLISLVSLRQPVLPQPLIKPENRALRGVLSMRIVLAPLLLFAIFYFLFTAGNPVFRKINADIFGNLFSFLEDVSYTYFFFIVGGILIARWIFMKIRKTPLKLPVTSFLQRRAGKQVFPGLSKALQREYHTAILTFALLNALLLSVNILDIKWVWFDFYVPEGFSLKEFVHDGVGWLILSLLISAGLVFYFFRANLNFYRSNKALRLLGHFWIAQNLVLTASVFIRTFHYIGFHGIASGRIALLIFLTMVAFSLTVLLFKVQQKRNAAFAIRWVSAFTLVLWGATALVNWDKVIAGVNLHHSQQNQIDVNNYLNLDPQVYPYVYAHLDKVEEQIHQHDGNAVRWISYEDISEFRTQLDRRASQYLEERQQLGVPSWSWADHRAEAQLNGILD